MTNDESAKTQLLSQLFCLRYKDQKGWTGTEDNRHLSIGLWK